MISCAADVIREYAPEVMFVHNGNIDHQRHVTGVFSSAVISALDIVDEEIGQLGEALEAAGVLDDTNFVLTSDHGQRQIVRTVKLNVYLKEAGFIETDERGKVKNWKAYSFSNAMSSLIYLKDPGDRETADRVYELLRKLCDEGIYGIGQVLTKEEVKEKWHLDGDFTWVVESDGYTISRRSPPSA